MSTSRVCFSSDAKPLYSFFAPLTALMWREVAGYRSLVMICGDFPALVADKLSAVGADVVNVPRVECCGAQAQAQLVRLLAYLAPGVMPDDYLLMGDVDAWPLQAAAFAPRHDLFLMYDESCLDRAGEVVYPMGYIGARASIWRDLMGLDGDDIAAALVRLYQTDQGLAKHPSGGVNYDEHLITHRIKAWSGFPSGVVEDIRGGFPIRGRVDRALWPKQTKAEGMIDAHLLRPGWTDENWSRIRPLLAQTLRHDWLVWADDYRSQYMEQMP